MEASLLESLDVVESARDQFGAQGVICQKALHRAGNRVYIERVEEERVETHGERER